MYDQDEKVKSKLMLYNSVDGLAWKPVRCCGPPTVWMHDVHHITSQPKLTLSYTLLGQQAHCDGQKLLLC